MKVMIPFQNPRTGEKRRVKFGFSWTLFLFSGLFGLPLFLRRLYGLAALFLCLAVLSQFGVHLIPNPQQRDLAWITLSALELGLGVWIGVKGNELTAKHLLELSWVFAEPHSELTRLAAGRWGLVVGGPEQAPLKPVGVSAQRS